MQVTKQLFYINEDFEIIEMEADDATYKIGVFLDKEGTIPFRSDYMKDIRIVNDHSGTAIWTDVPDGTYYVFELDENGNPIAANNTIEVESGKTFYYNVTNENGTDKIINNIDIKDLLTNDNGTYNNTYYQVKNELNVTEEEMNILMNSEPLNNKLKLVLDSIVKYSLRNNKEAKYSNDEMYNMIIEGINSTPNISEELKNKVIISSDRHKQDISDFLYDIEVSLKGD